MKRSSPRAYWTSFPIPTLLRSQVLKNAYGNDDTPIAALDPRVLLLWYLFFGIVPWFLNDVIVLLGLFVLTVATTRVARVAPLVAFRLALGVFSQTGYTFIVSLFFEGNMDTLLSLLVLTLKVATCSLASITVFSGLDPGQASANGLLWFGVTRAPVLLDRLRVSRAADSYGGAAEHPAVVSPARAWPRRTTPFRGKDSLGSSTR